MKVSVETQLQAVIDLPDIVFMNPTLAEIEILRSNEELPREFYCDKYHKVSSSCVAKVGGDLAYIHWVYLKGDYSRFLKIGDDSAEINYVLTLQQFRGRHISTAAFIYSMHSLKQKGIKNIYAVVHNKNIASIKSFRRAGFVEVGNILSIFRFSRKIKVN